MKNVIKNISDYKVKILLTVVVIVLFVSISIKCTNSDRFISGWAASFIISWLFYSFSVKKEIANAIEETTKNVESELNNQFNRYRESLNGIHNESKKVLLKMYENQLVSQLEADMAEIWDVRPGATIGEDADPTAMDNADGKYFKMYDKLHERSAEIANDIMKNL